MLFRTAAAAIAAWIVCGCSFPSPPERSAAPSPHPGVIIPLYSYPGDPAWQRAAASGKTLETIAIINPASGPLPCTTSTAEAYRQGIKQLQRGSVKVIGYVHTSYGARQIDTVKKEIDLYRECFSPLEGIFFDEVNSSAKSAPYYAELTRYLKQRDPRRIAVLNPGVFPDEAILSAADTLIIYEDEGENFHRLKPPPYAKHYPARKFAMLAYGVNPTPENFAKIPPLLHLPLGYLYLSDDGGENPWDTLSTYYERLVRYLVTLPD